MKQLKFSLILFLSFFHSAQAMEVTFNFDVYSSGADIYPCNAGIRHSPGGPGVACHFTGSTTGCQPGVPDCVCASAHAADVSHDFVTATVTNWDLTGTPVVMSAQASAAASTYGALITDGTELNSRLTSLTFNLGSETYGAGYYVEMCYRGPQIDYWMNGVGLNMTLDGSITFTDLAGISGSSTNYLNNAQAYAASAVVCDNQGQGTYQTAAVHGAYDTIASDIYFSGSNGDISQWAYDFAYTTNPTLMVSGGPVTSVYQGLGLSTSPTGPAGTIVPNSGVPRFCKVRYGIGETATGARLWNIHGATVQTFTRIQAN